MFGSVRGAGCQWLPAAALVKWLPVAAGAAAMVKWLPVASVLFSPCCLGVSKGEVHT